MEFYKKKEPVYRVMQLRENNAVEVVNFIFPVFPLGTNISVVEPGFIDINYPEGHCDWIVPRTWFLIDQDDNIIWMTDSQFQNEFVRI